MKKIKFFAIMAVVLTVFSACQKDEIVENLSSNYDSGNEEAGVLEFNSVNELQKVISELKAENMIGYNELKEINNFTSREEHNNLTIKSVSVDGEDIEAEPEDKIVHDPYLIKLLDEKRSIIVDGYYYRITEKGMFRTSKDKRVELDTFLEQSSVVLNVDNDGDTDQFVEVNDGIELFLPKKIFEEDNSIALVNSTLKSSNLDYAIMNECDESSKTIAGEIIAGVVGYSVNCENKFSSNRRVKTVFWAQNWFFHSSVGIKVKMQKRSLGIWWAKDAENIELGWEKIIYEVDYDLNPDFYNLSMDFNIFNYHFYDLAHFDKIWEIINQFKIKHGGYPTAFTLHKEMCERNFKEWTIRSHEYYDDAFADLVWYQKNGDYDKTINTIKGLSTKGALSWLKGELTSSWDPDETNTSQDWNNLPENKVMTLINESMEATRIFLPQEGALKDVNENKIEKILDYSKGVFSFGYSNKGGKSFFNATLYEAPASYKILDGSRIYGLAKYGGQWRGSRIVKN